MFCQKRVSSTKFLINLGVGFWSRVALIATWELLFMIILICSNCMVERIASLTVNVSATKHDNHQSNSQFFWSYFHCNPCKHTNGRRSCEIPSWRIVSHLYQPVESGFQWGVIRFLSLFLIYWLLSKSWWTVLVTEL